MAKTEGGHADTHPKPDVFPLLLAPTVAAENNTLRMQLIPLACWKLNDVRFDFDSSFVLPDSATEFAELNQLRKDHPGAPLSIWGHADPVGNDDYNKLLSGRRAEAIYAVLIRDAGRWEKLYSTSTQGDGWGLKSTQIMLKKLGFDPGPATGTMNSQTKKAVQDFQGKNPPLTVDGDPGKKTREKLFLAYMDAICPLKLTKADFLAKGADSNGKGDFQGCSEFNPVMVFSQSENTELSKPQNQKKRNEENGPNRRVMALLFRPGISVTPAKWPCPSANAGVGGCKDRFWSDGEKRRSNQAVRREFVKTKDTFACRFYHRLAISSPCEGGAPTTVIVKPGIDVTTTVNPIIEFIRA